MTIPLDNMQWDIKGGYWYTSDGRNITPQDILNYAKQLLDACKTSLQWIAKVSADQPEGDPTGIGTRAMQQYAKVEQAIRHAEEQTK